MKVKEVIYNLNNLNLQSKLDRLIEIGAPEIIIDSVKGKISEIAFDNFKVNGMQRKYKSVAEEDIISVKQAESTGYYFNKGKQKTIILKIEVESGTYYYDYFENKLGKEVEMRALSNVKYYESII